MSDSVNQNTYVSVISSIVCEVASKIEGVASVGVESGIINKFSSKSNYGVEIEITPSNMAVISLSINVNYGCKIPEVVCSLQSEIKKAVEDATCYKIKTINVTVIGVVFHD